MDRGCSCCDRAREEPVQTVKTEVGVSVGSRIQRNTKEIKEKPQAYRAENEDHTEGEVSRLC